MKKVINCKLIILLLTISCNNKSINHPVENSSSEVSELVCKRELRFNRLIESTIKLPQLQQYFRVQESLGQKELVLVKNEFLKNDFTFSRIKIPVKLMSQEEIESKNIKAYLDYKKISFNGDTAYVFYKYEVQGVGIKASFIINDSCEWSLIKSHLWEN